MLTSLGPTTAESCTAKRPMAVTCTVPLKEVTAVDESPIARFFGFSCTAAGLLVTEALSRSPPQDSRTIVAEVYAFICRFISASLSASV